MTSPSTIVVWSYGERYPFTPLPSFDPLTLSIIVCIAQTATRLVKLPYLLIDQDVVPEHESFSKLRQKKLVEQEEECENSLLMYNHLVKTTLNKVIQYYWWYKECNYNYIKYSYGQVNYYPKSLICVRRQRKKIMTSLEFEDLNEDSKVNQLAHRIFSTLEGLLDEKKKYFSNTDKPCSLDAYVFGYLAPILCGSFPDRTLHHIIINDYPKLHAFVLAVGQEFFGITLMPINTQEAHEYLQKQLKNTEKISVNLSQEKDEDDQINSSYYYLFITAISASIAFFVWNKDSV